MRRVVITTSTTGNSAVVPMDHRAQFFNVGIQVVVSATATFNVQATLDDIYNTALTPTWFNLTNFTAGTANVLGNLTIPVAAIRLNTSANTGTVTMTLLQSSGQG